MLRRHLFQLDGRGLWVGVFALAVTAAGVFSRGANGWVAEDAAEEGGEDGQAGANDADGLFNCGPGRGSDEGIGYVCGDDFGEGGDADDGGDDDAGGKGKKVSFSLFFN